MFTCGCTGADNAVKPSIFACVALLLALTASAKPIATIAEYQRYKAANGDDWKAVMVYIVGMGDALGWANAYLSLNDKPPLYCEPKQLHLNAQKLVRIIDDEIAAEKAGIGIKEPLTDSAPLAPVLMYGLIHKFPCKD
jgi:hypothetical protein